MTRNSDYEKTIECQFDSFCKAVLRNCARNIYVENKRRNQKCISLELLSPDELSQLCVCDTYNDECTCFSACDYDVFVESILIAKAIESLSKKQQDIILLSFFLNLKDVEIATLINLAKSTAHYHKENALKRLRKYLEEQTDET